MSFQKVSLFIITAFETSDPESLYSGAYLDLAEFSNVFALFPWSH
jgi:hypothetical protein